MPKNIEMKKKNNKKSIVKVSGSKTAGFIIKIIGYDDFYSDVAVTFSELQQIGQLIKKIK